MKIKKLIAAFLSATVLATSVAPVFAVNSAIGTENAAVVEIASTSSYIVTADTPIDEGAVYTDDENLTVTNMFASTVNVNLEKDPGDPIEVDIEGNKCCYFLAVRSSSTPSSYDTVSPDGAKSPLDIVAKKNGTLKIYHRWFTDGRSMGVMEMNADGTYTNQLVGERTVVSGNILPEEENPAVSVEYGYDAFEVEAGKSYIVYATGFTSEVFGWTFEPEGSSAGGDEDPNPTTAPVNGTYTITNAEVDASNKLSVTLSYDGEAEATAKLIAVNYNADNSLNDVKMFDIAGTTVSNLDYTVDKTKTTKLFIWENTTTVAPLASSVYVIEASSGDDGGDVTPTPTPGPTEDGGESKLPADQAWTTLDSELNALVAAANSDGAAIGPYKELSGYGKWDVKTGKKAKYVHTNGDEYNFTTSWNAGTGNRTNKRMFHFTPKAACIVTVVYSAQATRPMYIYQGEELLASGEDGTLNGMAATLVADIEDPSKGDVIVYGGNSGKDLFGIFADYYDPNVLVERTVSGNLNYTTDKDTTNMKVVFTDQKDGTRYEVPYASTYTVQLRQNRSYDITVEGIEDVCATLDTNVVTLYKKDLEYNIDLVDIVDGEVTGEIVTHGLDMTNVTLTFTAKDDPTITKNATIAALADGEIPTSTNALSVVLTPNKEYTVTATGCDGYELSPLSKEYTMVAGDTKPFKNILFTKVAQSMEFKNTLTVGADKEYQTITDAVKAVGNMTERPAGEEGRVTIVIDPGTYVEQVTVDKDYVTLTAADPANRPTISFYYGIGYLYYSASGGYYSEDRYVQRTEMGPVTRWGSTVRVTGTNFLAENIIFENSFSFRVTEEEKLDGVTAAGPGWYSDVSGKPDRTVEGYDARTKNAVERAAAFAGDGKNYELYNCDFMSSQDTLYTGNNGYFKNCYIEGGTDYIFGGNSIVFDDCTLAWHGYSDEANGGYITACKTSSSVGNDGSFNLNNAGYLFRNCTVTTSKYCPDNKFAVGGWGRNWGGANCQVVFLNTKVENIGVPGAWKDMGGALNTSILYVDGVTDKDGNAIKTDNVTYNPNGTMAENGYTLQDPTAYFGDWTPKYYTAE